MLAGEPVTESVKPESLPRALLFSPAMVDELREWSEPVTVRIVEMSDGALIMEFKRYACEES